MKQLTLARAVSGLFAAGALLSAPAHAAFNPADTSVQMFRWKWNDIAKECTNYLGPQGYGAVQVSPPTASNVANRWWEIYQPVSFTSLNSRMGSEGEFQTMIHTCHAAGVRVYVDAVVNHMAAGGGIGSDGSPWNATSLSYPNFSAPDFHNHCDINDKVDYEFPGNRNSVMNCRLVGLPDLKTESPYVQGQIRNFFNKLVAMGADGIRIDAAKHMQPWHITEILNGTNRTTKAGEALWLTQEVIPDKNVVRSEYFANGTLNEFQFSYAMRAAFRNDGTSISQIPAIMGTPAGWGGAWNFIPSGKATVFVNNWDTERNGSSLVASDYRNGRVNDTVGTKRYDLANIFMLAWPYGHAQLHSGFRFTDSDAGPPADSPFDVNGNPLINQQWDFIHRWSDIANMVKFRSTVSGTGVDWFVQGNQNQIAFARGNKGFLALNNDSANWNASLKTMLPAGTYCNVVNGQLTADRSACTGSSLTVDGNGIVTVNIGGNNGSATVPAVALHVNQKVNGEPPSGCTSVPVKFRVANAGTVPGQSVYVVGNRPELGNWTGSASDVLTIEGNTASAPWSRTFNLPPKTAIQFKFLKKGGGSDVWERSQATSSGNREATTAACGGPVQVLDVGSFAF